VNSPLSSTNPPARIASSRRRSTSRRTYGGTRPTSSAAVGCTRNRIGSVRSRTRDSPPPSTCSASAACLWISVQQGFPARADHTGHGGDHAHHGPDDPVRQHIGHHTAAAPHERRAREQHPSAGAAPPQTHTKNLSPSRGTMTDASLSITSTTSKQAFTRSRPRPLRSRERLTRSHRTLYPVLTQVPPDNFSACPPRVGD
jgi:hypothetical protein